MGKMENIVTAGYGQNFQMKCPQHKGMTLLSSKVIRVREKGSIESKTSPLFYCAQCKAYYISQPGGKKEGRIGIYKDGKPVYASPNAYTPYASPEKPVQKKAKPAASKPIQKKSPYDAIKE